LKIKYQVLLLVTVMLAVEVALLIGMNFLLEQSEQEARNVQYTKDVVADSGDYIGDVYEVYRLWSGAGKEDPAVWQVELRRAKAAMQFHSNRLVHEAPNEEALIKCLKKVNAEANETAQLYEQIMSLPDQTSVMTRTSLRFRDRMDSFFASLSRFSAEQQKFRMADMFTSRSWRHRLKDNLIMALIINVLVAVAVAAHLIRKIVLRLDVLVQNVLCMKYKMPLNPPVTGNDEITELDQAFRNMLHSLQREQKALTASESRIRNFVSGVPVGLMSLLPSGEIEFCNVPLTTMLSHAPGELDGSHIFKLFDMGGLSHEQFWTQVKTKAVSQAIELFAVDKHNERLLVELILSDVGEGRSFLASVTNIQDKYKLMKLREAFVAMISHELRTPLTSLLGFLSLSVNGVFGKFEPEFTQHLVRSQQSTTRLIGLVNELLELEKLDSGNARVLKVPCELQRVFDQACDSVSIFAETQGVTLIMPKSCELEIIGDPDRLTQVLVNLISNAVSVSLAKGRVYVDWTTEPDLIKISVRDEGHGIAAAHKEIIFERFQQIAEERERKRTGTGLGLAICKSIVEQHGGVIGVESELGHGSMFWFTLPYEYEQD